MTFETVDVDVELVDRVMRSHRLGSKAAAVDYALRRLIAEPAAGLVAVHVDSGMPEPLSREEALEMRGSGWDVAPNAAAGDGGRPNR